MKQPFGRTKNRQSSPIAANPDLECTHCGIAMSGHLGRESKIRYYCCPSCGRWMSSTYSDVFHSDTKVRIQPAQVHPPNSPQFQEVKERLERWMIALDQQDPYYLLGVSPSDSSDAIRNRYRELALNRHPDRGGSVLEMRELNLAYERIVRHRNPGATGGELAGMPAALPGRSKP